MHMKNYNTQDFIKKSIEIHGDKYDYSKTEYVDNSTKVCIICPKHGEFWQLPANHLSGSGCKKCANEDTTDKRRKAEFVSFLEKAKKIYGDKYDYSKAKYVNARTKICIICPEHGEFWQTPRAHLNGSGCKICSDRSRSKDTSYFIERAKKVHGDKYDYSKVEYINNKTPVCIICPEHGEFWQSLIGHVSNHQGCPKCSHKEPYTLETWIKRAKEIHGNKYDYSKVVYTGEKNKVIITCPKHGDFLQRASSHIEGYGCPSCRTEIVKEKTKKSKEQFIKEAREIHGDKYDYSKVEYVNSRTKVCIICPEHGEFWQTPIGHINNFQGCPFCKQSKMEEYLSRILRENGYLFEREKTFDWLVFQNNMELDFYLPKYNFVIEAQGGQHFFPMKQFGGEDAFVKIQERDKKKYDLLLSNGINVVYILSKRYKKYLKENDMYLDNFLFEQDIIKDNTILFNRITSKS